MTEFDDRVIQAQYQLAHEDKRDLVEVVRCKDCTYWRFTSNYCYKHEQLRTKANFFCADGERK